QAVERARFERDGSVLTTSDDGTAVRWDENGHKLDVYRQPDLIAALPSPDGRYVLTLTTAGSVALWEQGGKLRFTLREAPQGGLAVLFASAPCAFSPDGTRVAVGDPRGVLRVWDTATGQSIGASSAHRDKINTVAFSPDGAHIVTASDDGTAR